MRAYAYQNHQTIVERSASGGAYLAIAESLCEIAGEEVVVAGAAWTKELLARHELEACRDQYARFSGSKYIGSDIEHCLVALAQELTDGKWVLFTGTPCQIHALKLYVQRHALPDKKLYTMDLICHGVPPGNVWLEFLKWLEIKKKGRVIAASFRDKQLGWQGYHMRLTLNDGRVLGDDYETRCYLRMYFSQMILRRSCFSCPYTTLTREADITVGDFWGIEQLMPDFPPEKGVSLVLLSTAKGEAIMKKIIERRQGNVNIRECNPEICLPFQVNLTHSHQKPGQYEQFQRDLRELGFDAAIRRHGFYTRIGKARYFAGHALRVLKIRKDG